MQAFFDFLQIYTKMQEIRKYIQLILNNLNLCLQFYAQMYIMRFNTPKEV